MRQRAPAGSTKRTSLRMSGAPGMRENVRPSSWIAIAR
eukprot:CAMPEP_0179152784 /NCGR_PEP_ID=MMETSP0796-20121207/74259_1 /TAXON_ID=73915 /ORGANISM="Pyrodinium bahamense, Strain pbaha01" /LENGTH=37 /DNA_ID= /DNA_START= /DNA_END= /DNA_ORIENTATION=